MPAQNHHPSQWNVCAYLSRSNGPSLTFAHPGRSAAIQVERLSDVLSAHKTHDGDSRGLENPVAGPAE
jgi:hypothetical protein